MHGAMNLQPLSPVIGAEVSGVDLRLGVSPGELSGILKALAQYHLLLFRDQELAAEQQKRFAANFGTITAKHSAGDDVLFISNTVKDGAVGNGELLFHCDHSYFERPDTHVNVLYALEIPSSGGDTLFA